MAGLAEPANLPDSQAFAGSFYKEPEGWVIYANGHPLKAYATKFPGSVWRKDLHKGLDQYGAAGTKLGAMEAGTVKEEFTDGLGTKVMRVYIRGHADVRFQYTHVRKYLVPVGAVVSRLQPIAELGNTGSLSTGAHNHIELQIREKGTDGVWRWMSYDPARFCLPGTFKYGAGYHGGAVIFGGDMIYDDRIYPIRAITINAGVNVRADKTTDAAVILLTTSVTPATQINELPGGSYTIGGVDGYLWAKVRLNVGGSLKTGYVAKPLIKVV